MALPPIQWGGSAVKALPYRSRGKWPCYLTTLVLLWGERSSVCSLRKDVADRQVESRQDRKPHQLQENGAKDFAGRQSQLLAHPEPQATVVDK